MTIEEGNKLIADKKDNSENEWNKLIAEYMGAVWKKWINEFEEDCQGYIIWNQLYPTNRLHYHDDWNWLMKVVEKINSERFYVCIDSWAGVEIYDRSKRLTGEPIVTIDRDRQPLILIVWQAVTQFIQWYNNQTPKQ